MISGVSKNNHPTLDLPTSPHNCTPNIHNTQSLFFSNPLHRIPIFPCPTNPSRFIRICPINIHDSRCCLINRSRRYKNDLRRVSLNERVINNGLEITDELRKRHMFFCREASIEIIGTEEDELIYVGFLLWM